MWRWFGLGMRCWGEVELVWTGDGEDVTCLHHTGSLS